MALAVATDIETVNWASKVPGEAATTVTLLIVATGTPSSLRIVPVAFAEPLAPATEVRLTVKVSLASWTVSPLTSTVMVFEVCPARR